ncbi:MAG: hypothetical protein HIU92_06935 [Proteobacteria bacterium]|nr:hypothetical protein [Pseudomonadota bacterium]
MIITGDILLLVGAARLLAAVAFPGGAFKQTADHKPARIETLRHGSLK